MFWHGGSFGSEIHVNTPRNRLQMHSSDTAEQGTDSGDTPSTSNAMQASCTMNILPGTNPPGQLNVQTNITDNWKAYKQASENYAIITNLNSQPEAYKVALFLHCVGPDAVQIYNGLAFASDEDSKSLTKPFEMFDLHTVGEINETYERYIFNNRNQKPDESIDAYVTTLRDLAKTCNFCDLNVLKTVCWETELSWVYRANTPASDCCRTENWLLRNALICVLVPRQPRHN